MGTLVKRLVETFVAPVMMTYLKKDRRYSYEGIRILVKKGVFHPGLFFSTKFLLAYLKTLDLKDKNFLELGAGSGLISFFAFNKGAHVTASDKSKIAISGLKENSIQLNFPIQIIDSDMFNNIPVQTFDVIAVNPPYYPKNANNEVELAWYCGTDFDFFRRFFENAGNYMNDETLLLITLSEDCHFEHIKKIGKQNGFNFRLIKKKRINWELNYLFAVVKVKDGSGQIANTKAKPGGIEST